MRIGIDVRILERNKAGFERYLRYLLRGLAGIDSKNEYILYSDHALDRQALGLKDNFSVKVMGQFGHSQIWTNFNLPREVNRDKLDIFHFPASSVWMHKNKKTVVTLHDISPVLFPELKMASRGMILYFKFLFRLIAQKADIIITDCRKSKEDILGYLKLKEDRIKVIYPGFMPYPAEHNFADTDNVCRKFNIKKKFIFFVGTFQKRKNLPGLIKAYEKFVNKSGFDYDLVIAGTALETIGSCFDTEKKLVGLTGLKNRIHFVGRVDDSDLMALYKNAELFLFVTFYEAFGFPVLEAMSCGTPVIVANNSNGPELAAGAAFLVDPFDTDKIVEALIKVLSDKELYNSLVEKGLKRVKEFSCEQTAAETLSIYKQLS